MTFNLRILTALICAIVFLRPEFACAEGSNPHVTKVDVVNGRDFRQLRCRYSDGRVSNLPYKLYGDTPVQKLAIDFDGSSNERIVLFYVEADSHDNPPLDIFIVFQGVSECSALALVEDFDVPRLRDVDGDGVEDLVFSGLGQAGSRVDPLADRIIYLRRHSAGGVPRVSIDGKKFFSRLEILWKSPWGWDAKAPR